MYSVDDDIENIPFFEKELLADHCEEDIALIATPCVNLSDEEDIDDGEFWEDEEDSDIDNDTECSHDSQPPVIASDHEEEQSKSINHHKFDISYDSQVFLPLQYYCQCSYSFFKII